MIKVFTTHDVVHAGYLKSLLEERGIGTIMRNEFLGGGAGELPLNECWPEIWVTDARDADIARKIIAESSTPIVANQWVCTNCEESLEGQFTKCWQCGAPRATPD